MIAPRLAFGCDLCDAEVRCQMRPDHSWRVFLHQRGDTMEIPRELLPDRADDETLAQLASILTGLLRAHPCTGSPN